MPTIAQQVAQNQARIAAGGENTPAPTAENLVQMAASPSLDLPVTLPQRGMFPANLVLASDRSDSSREFRGAGARSATFPYPPTAPVVTKTIPTVQQIASDGSKTTGPLLQTNNVPNIDQAVLNLTQGSGIVLTPDENGAVAIASTAGGDGLVHGDPIWDLDSAVAKWRDDFFAGTAVLTNSPGDLRWDGVSGATTGSKTGMAGLPHAGWLTIAPAATANAFGGIWFPGSTTQGVSLPLLDYPGWKMVWVFGFPAQRSTAMATPFPLLKKQLYIGLVPTFPTAAGGGWTPAGGANARSPFFIGLRYDTDATAPAISDSTFNFEVVANPDFSSARNNTQGTVSNTAITPTENVIYRFEIIYTATNSLVMNLNGSNGSNATHTFTSIPTLSSNSTNSQSISLLRNNGVGNINYAAKGTAATSNDVWTTGSIVTLTNAPIGKTFYNGTWTLNVYVVAGYSFPLAGASDTSNASGCTLTGYPGLSPFFAFGNDTQAAPAAATISIDFFSLVWNSGLAASPLAVVNTASRWTTGS